MIAQKSVLLPALFIFMLVSSLAIVGGLQANHAYADEVNTPICTSNPKISGLWNTGMSEPVLGPGGACEPPVTPPQLLALPPQVHDPAHPWTMSPGYGIHHNNNYVEDPHWALKDVKTAAQPSTFDTCQLGPFPRKAVTMFPPYDSAASPGNPGWVWWRATVATLETGSARWVGARPNSYHDNIVAFPSPYESNIPTGTTCNGGAGDLSVPGGEKGQLVFTYELVGGFNVGSCVVPSSVQLNPRWGADDVFEMFINGQSVLGPLVGGSLVTSNTPLGTGAFNVGPNSLEIKVYSTYPLQGFAISWDEPTTICNETKPYFKVYGNDIAAGGQFGACDLSTLPNNRATIIGQARGSQNPGYTPLVLNDHYKGASTQLAAFALGQIYNFFSGGTQSPRRSSVASSPVNGLTFGNFGDPTIGDIHDWDPSNTILDPNRVLEDGGKGGQFRCMPDYFSIVSRRISPNPQVVAAPINLAATSAGYYQTNTVATITNGANVTGKRAIVVDGDVYIGPGGITYGGYTGPGDMPSVYVIAKGNIYIDRSIRNLSGVYIAQPRDDGTKGTIYTCATSTGPVLDTNLLDNCNQSLTVTGAFIANRVRFLRTNGDVASSVPNELWSGGAGDNIAEIFKSSGELYLSVPDQLRKSNSTTATYDSITSLPPVL